MITKYQLYDIGYLEKPDNIKMHDGSTDFKHEGFKSRPYLVNLKEGRINIDFPLNMQKEKALVLMISKYF